MLSDNYTPSQQLNAIAKFEAQDHVGLGKYSWLLMVEWTEPESMLREHFYPAGKEGTTQFY
jgi:hypothetical protein